MRRLLVVSLLAAFAGFGCGQDDPTVPEAPEETTEATEAPKASEPSGELEYNDQGTETFTETDFDVEVELDSFSFTPTFIKAPGASMAMITLTNGSDVPHTFTADELDVDEELQPGDSTEIEVDIGTETRYEFYCRFHESQGMRGAFQPH